MTSQTPATQADLIATLEARISADIASIACTTRHSVPVPSAAKIETRVNRIDGMIYALRLVSNCSPACYCLTGDLIAARATALAEIKAAKRIAKAIND